MRRLLVQRAAPAIPASSGTAKTGSPVRCDEQTRRTCTAHKSATQCAHTITMIHQFCARHFSSAASATDGQLVQQLTKEQRSVALCVLATARLCAVILVVLRIELTVAVPIGAPYRIDDGKFGLRTQRRLQRVNWSDVLKRRGGTAQRGQWAVMIAVHAVNHHSFGHRDAVGGVSAYASLSCPCLSSPSRAPH